jgi:hypothetical protein
LRKNRGIECSHFGGVGRQRYQTSGVAKIALGKDDRFQGLHIPPLFLYCRRRVGTRSNGMSTMIPEFNSSLSREGCWSRHQEFLEADSYLIGEAMRYSEPILNLLRDNSWTSIKSLLRPEAILFRSKVSNPMNFIFRPE